jgi:hypothetical protein
MRIENDAYCVTLSGAVGVEGEDVHLVFDVILGA